MVILPIMQGAVFPCNHAIWSKWAPPLERTTLVTMAISGDFTSVFCLLCSSLILLDPMVSNTTPEVIRRLQRV